MKLWLPHACQPGCALCVHALPLDAAALPSEVLEARLDHAERTNQRRVYLQGTDLAQNPHLPAIVHSATTRGLEAGLVEDGCGLDLPARALSLHQMGIATLYLSPAGSPAESSETVSMPDVRKQIVAVLLALSRLGRPAAGVHISLTRRSLSELQGILRLQARLGIQELLISEVRAADRVPGALDAAEAVAALERTWCEANALQIRLCFIGFDCTRHVNPAIGSSAPVCDGALLETIRQGIPFASTRAGIHALGTPEHPSTLSQLVKCPEDIRQLGLELAARGCPFVDLPPCLGGTQLTSPSAAAGRATPFIKSDACSTCPFDERCPGAPEMLDGFPLGSLRPILRPPPAAAAYPRSPKVVILSSEGQDLVFYASTLPGLADALRQRGADVEIVSPWLSVWNPKELPYLPDDVPFQRRWDQVVSEISKVPTQRRLWKRLAREMQLWVEAKRVRRNPYIPSSAGTSGVEAWLASHNLGRFDLVIASDFPTLRLALATGSLAPTARIVVLDFHMLKGMDDAVAGWLAPSARAAEGGWWPSERLILESPFPGYVKLYLNYGVPLEQVAWRPYSLYGGHFPQGPDVHQCHVIMSGGNHLRDLETLRAATERLPREVHPIILYDQGERFAGNQHLLHEGEVPLRSFYHALANSRFVVMPLREDTNRAAGVTVLAMALMAGRPVVATGITAIRDYVRHDVEALLVPPDDPAALADAITRLDTDPVLLSTLAAGAREAGRRLSTDHWAEQILSGVYPFVPLWTAHGWRHW